MDKLQALEMQLSWEKMSVTVCKHYLAVVEDKIKYLENLILEEVKNE